MPRKNQMIGLMELAWNRCKFANINTIIHYFVGAAFAFVVFSVCFLLQFIPLQTYVNFTLPHGAIDINSAMIVAGVYGFINAVCVLILLAAIVIALADYALNFATVCYFYDNRSWDLVNCPVSLFNRLAAYRRKNNAEYLSSVEKSCKELTEEINKLKSGDQLPGSPSGAEPLDNTK